MLPARSLLLCCANLLLLLMGPAGQKAVDSETAKLLEVGQKDPKGAKKGVLAGSAGFTGKNTKNTKGTRNARKKKQLANLKGKIEGLTLAAAAGGKIEQNQKSDQGDRWPCPKCGFMNFSFRQQCGKCSGAVKGKPKGGKQGKGGGKGDKRQGKGDGAGGKGGDKSGKQDGKGDQDKKDKDGKGICRLFRDSGTCRFGDRCKFSHT